MEGDALNRRSTIWWAAPLLGATVLLLDVPLLRLLSQSTQGDESNYARVLETEAFRSVLVDSFRIAFTTASVCVVLAAPVAWWLASTSGRTRTLVAALVLAPLAVGVLVRAYSAVLIFGRRGALNSTLIDAGLIDTPFRFLFREAAVTVGTIQILFPLAVLPMWSALRRADGRLLDASASLGAGGSARLRTVVAPMMLPSAIGAFTTVFVLALGFFVTPALLGGGRVTMVATLLDTMLNRLADWGLAAALSAIVLVVAVIGLLVVLTSESRRVTSGPQAVPLDQRPRPRGRSLLTAYAVGVTVAFAVPVVLIVPLSLNDSTSLGFPPEQLSLRWYRELVDDVAWRNSLASSLRLALQSSTLAVLLGVPAAYAVSRAGRRVRALLQVQFLLPIAVPEVVVAVSLFFSLARLDALGSWSGLLASHVILIVPFVVSIVLPAFDSLDRELELGARSLGAGPFRTMTTVLVPAAAPAIASAWLFAALASFDLLVVNLFVAGLVDTVSVQAFESLEEQITPIVAALSVTTIGLAAIAGVTVLALRATVQHTRRTVFA